MIKMMYMISIFSKLQMREALDVLTIKNIGPKLDADSWSVDIEGSLENFTFTTRCFNKETTC